MVKQIYTYMAALLFAGMVVGCSPEALDNVPLSEGDVPIQLNGAMTRALGDPDDPGDGQLITTGYPLKDYSSINFRLTARTIDAPVSTYFINRTIGIGEEGDTGGRNKITGNIYYPLGKKEINLYAYTNATATETGDITLNAGTALANDYLLGTGTEADGITPKAGDSENPIEYITFKHLMTRVDVKIDVDVDVEPTKPQSISMGFVSGEHSIVGSGAYNIFADNYKANSSSGNFGFSFNSAEIASSTVKTYYLVPNGADLTNSTNPVFSSLVIDDYTALPADYGSLRFPKTDLGNDFVLEPGLAYDLTFKIN